MQSPKEWADFVIEYLGGQAYGTAHGLRGYKDVIQFYEMRQKLEIDLLKSLSIPSLVIEHSGAKWDRCHEEMIRFIWSSL